MNFKVIKQLYKKEILDVLRDKKTIIMMVIVPLLIYPLMFVGGMVMMSKVTTQMDTQTYEIAVDFMDTNPELVEMFLHPDDDTLHFKLCDLNVMDADISMILRGEKINAIVYENEDGTGYNIAYLSSVTNSSYAEQKVRQVLSAYSDSLTNQSLEAAGLDPDTVLHPFEVEDDDRASTEETTGSLLGVIVPFMLVVSLLMGTMYPANDWRGICFVKCPFNGWNWCISVQTGGTDDQYGFENTGVKIRSGNLSLLPVYSCFCSFDQCAFHVFLRICKDLQGGK